MLRAKSNDRKKNISHNDSELEKKKWAKQKHAWIAWTSRIKRGEEKKVSRVTNRLRTVSDSSEQEKHNIEVGTGKKETRNIVIMCIALSTHIPSSHVMILTCCRRRRGPWAMEAFLWRGE